MQVSSLQEYGLRCALALARNYGLNTSSTEIAKSEGLSGVYVAKIMHLLKKRKILKAARGTLGGFQLARDPSSISIREVLDCFVTKPSQEFCSHHSGQFEQCSHHNRCSIRPVWSLMTQLFNDFLDHLSLQDLLQNRDNIQKLIYATWMNTTERVTRL